MNKKIIQSSRRRLGQTFLFIISFTVPLCIYVILSLYLKNWIVDDAGISFVYSRSLADGYGLVPQPGAEKVEGYSNFLWVLIYTPFFLINWFDPVITPKIISIIFVGLLFYFNTKICTQLKRSSVNGLIINSLIALNAPFIIWTCSGLENSLYVLLIVLLIYISIKYSQERKLKLIIIGSLITFLICITRPDGILFTLLFPVAIFLNGEKFKKMIPHLLVYAGIAGFLLLSMILFRWYYFHDTVPNTYYAKEASTSDLIGELLYKKNEFKVKCHSIFRSIGGSDFIYIVYSLMGIWIIQLGVLGKKEKFHFFLFFGWLISIIIYILLPYDVMGEYRFATPFIVFTHIFFCLIAAKTIDILPKFKKSIVVLLLTFLGIYALVNISDHHKRLLLFRKVPTVPFEGIKRFYADKFNHYADVLDISNGSLLLPDVGATYFYSNLRVYDSAGLCDKTIAKGKFTKNRKLMQDYIFIQIKPTFIHLHDGWADLVRPDEYAGFRNDYMTIYETISEYYTENRKVNIYSGDYIRRDVITEQNNPILQDIISKRKNIFD